MGEHPKDGHTYWLREDRTAWAYVGPWKHPRHQPYHVNWTGEYAVMQVSGNFTNEMRLIELARFDELFELAWEPATVCKFCGFTRMRPCLVRQTCANLTDYRLEPDDVHDDRPARATMATTCERPAEATVYVTVSGLTGVGKSAVYAELTIALRALGLKVVHADPSAWRGEMGLLSVGGNDLQDFKPTIILSEQNIPRGRRP